MRVAFTPEQQQIRESVTRLCAGSGGVSAVSMKIRT